MARKAPQGQPCARRSKRTARSRSRPTSACHSGGYRERRPQQTPHRATTNASRVPQAAQPTRGRAPATARANWRALSLHAVRYSLSLMSNERVLSLTTRWMPPAFGVLMLAAAIVSRFAVLSNDSFPLLWQARHLSFSDPATFYNGFFPIGY